MVIFNADKKDTILIGKIIDRVFKKYTTGGCDRLSFIMDLEAIHCNGNPLDLEKLLKSPGLDLAHDIFGIRKNINRSTGKLENFFLPRCSKPEVK